MSGIETVEVIIYKLSNRKKIALNAKAFSNMKKLRVLQIHNVHLPEGLDYLSNELRLLESHEYPLKSLPSSCQLNNIVALNLCHSRIQQLWKGFKLLNKLKFINLSHCENLTKMPDFTGVPNLESMILEGCKRLLEVHQSIGVRKRLILLNLKDCKSFSSLPSIIKWESLEVCILSGCSKLSNFPEIISKLEFLKKLDVSGTAIGQFPSSTFLSMKNLEVLSFGGCKGPSYKSWHLLCPFRLMQRRGLEPMPLMLHSLSGLCSLTNLDLGDCNLSEGAIPSDFGCLSSLRDLILDNNNFVALPASISRLSSLKYLHMNNCKRLQSLPSLSGLCSLTYLDLRDCNLLEGAIPSDIGCLSSLRMLRLDNNNFVALPASINRLSSLEFLNLNNCKRLESLPSLSGLCSLTDLDLSDCNLPEGAIPSDIGCLSSLRDLILDNNNFVTLPASIEFSFIQSQVKGLEVKKCGVRPVYEHDVEEFNQIMDDKSEDFEGSTMNGAVIKRIHDECDRAEASGSDSFVEEAQPKRLKTTPKFV